MPWCRRLPQEAAIQGQGQVPVSEIARTRPVLLPDVEPEKMRQALDAFPYQRFPVGSEANIVGIITRLEMEAALA